jgi:poly(3-hydroxybutyrate) depolymerase
VHYVQAGVGHYGVFNGTRWRTEIQPRIREFIRSIQHKRLADEDAPRTATYKAHTTTTDVTPDWSSPKKSNGHLNGNGRSHPLAAGE